MYYISLFYHENKTIRVLGASENIFLYGSFKRVLDGMSFIVNWR